LFGSYGSLSVMSQGDNGYMSWFNNKTGPTQVRALIENYQHNIVLYKNIDTI